jgi:hypothetical protein
VDVGDDAAANLQMVVSELGYGLPSPTVCDFVGGTASIPENQFMNRESGV